MSATIEAPASVAPLTTHLSDHERRCLRRALDHLTAGDSAGFHYALWIGFGDAWQAYRQSLIRAGCIAFRPRAHQAEPTPLTRNLLLAIDADPIAA